MVLNVKTGVLEYCVAGHPPPLIYRGNGDVIPLAVGGPLIGYYPDYEFQSARHSLEPGDFIILYTDGLIEAQNKEGETFGEDRLLFSIRKYANQPNEVLINSIIDDVCSFKEHDPFIDDVTVIAIKYA
jgi:sigma-B regulation protein RsbU (phosphoserine phosphatase)